MALTVLDTELDNAPEWDGSVAEVELADLEDNKIIINYYNNGWLIVGQAGQAGQTRDENNYRKINLNDLTHEELDQLVNNPSFTKIGIDSHTYPVISEDTILHILSSNYITNFSLSMYKVNDKIIKAIVDNKNLKECKLVCCGITNEMCKILITSASITYLHLRYDKIDLESVKTLCTSNTITRLDLWWNGMDLECCKILAKNKNLTHLDIGENQITDQGVIYLLNNSNITHLDIQAVYMKDEELVLQHIKNNNNLVYLGTNCAFNDYEIEKQVEEHIAKNKNHCLNKQNKA